MGKNCHRLPKIPKVPCQCDGSLEPILGQLVGKSLLYSLETLLGRWGRMGPAAKCRSSAGTSPGVGIPIVEPLHIAADTLWLPGRNAVTFAEESGKFGFEKCASRKKKKAAILGKGERKKNKAKETNPPAASQLCFSVLPQGQRWQLAGWQPACGCHCSPPKAMGRGQEALKSSPVRETGGGRQLQTKM